MKQKNKDYIQCDFCGAVKNEVTFTIGASTHADWCMIYGTGKMACPKCYGPAQAEATAAIDQHVAYVNGKADGQIKPSALAAVSQHLGVQFDSAQAGATALSYNNSAVIQSNFGPSEAKSFEVVDAKRALLPVIAKIKSVVFTKEYQAKATDAECLGILIAKFFEWDGTEILRAASAGLTDANYHEESAAVDKLLENCVK